MDEDLTDIVNFISLQESKKNKNTPKDDEDDKESEEANLLDLSLANAVPVTPPESGGSIESSPTGDVIKRKLTTSQAPKSVKSAVAGSSGVMGFVGSSPSIAMSRTGFPLNAPNIRDIVAKGSLSRMPIAASYDPFVNNNEELTENVKMMRSKVIRLLSKEPHKTEINKMKQELSGE